MNKQTKKLIVERELAQKTVVITGASSGAGMAAALAFAKEKATLVLAARRDKALTEVAEECELLGATAVVVPTDVSDPEAMRSLASTAFAIRGHIDVWVNNAGVLAAGQFESTPIEVHDRVIKINLLGYMHGAHAVLPYFKEQGHGVLINNISVGAWVPTPYAAGYTASKFGLQGFTEALRGELKGWPAIHICDLFPAFLDTPGIQHAANYTGKELAPAPPVYDPERVAKAMVALAQNPRNSSTTDWAAPVFKLSYSLFPSLTLSIAAKMMKTYFKNAHPIQSTTGNLFAPSKFGTSVLGGWQSRLKHRATKPTPVTYLLVGLAAGLYLLGKSR